MKRKIGFGRWIAIVSAIAIFLYWLSRRFDLGFFSRFTDKIQDMLLSKKTSQRIYDAAISRLTRNFSQAQSEVLAELMVQQAQYETANYTSKVLQNNQNAFGYKYFKGSIYQKGPGTVSPEMNQYGRYDDVTDSAREVADWIGRRKKDFADDITEQDYANSLSKNKYMGQSAYLYAKGLLVYENKG